MYQHNCIKCKTSYRDNEVDNYLCSPCIEFRNKVAKEIDSKYSTILPEKVPSELELFEMEGKTVVDQKGVRRTFAKA